MGKVRMTKSQIIEGLKKVAGFISANAEIQAEIDFVVDEYAENDRNVTMEDLKPIIASVESFTKKGFVQLIAEAEEKPEEKKSEEKKAKVLPKKSTDKAETSKKVLPKKQEANNPEEKEVNKSEEVQEEVKEEKTTAKKPTTKKKQEEELAEKLPQLLKSDSLKADLVARPDLKTIQDIAKAYADGTDFVIATYWTRRHLKQFANSYDPLNINPNRPTAFEHDLDLIEVTYANDLVVTGVSLYSSVPNVFLPINFDRDEEYGLRFANGVEFEIYEVVEEVEE